MEHNYLIGELEEAEEVEDMEMRIVTASCEEEALAKYAREVTIKSEMFLENAYGKAINDDFVARFFFQTEEEHEYFQRTGWSNLSNTKLKKRIREYFGEHGDFADLYTTFYFQGREEINTIVFPEEMLLYMLNGSNWAKLAVINMAEIERL